MTDEANTVWRPRNNLTGEYASSSNYDLSDSSSNLLVDSSGNYLVSGDSALTLIAGTTWSAMDGS